MSAPFLVEDFAPGANPYGVNPQSLSVAGGRLYFSGQDPSHGDEPWVSDGSSAGTGRLADLCPGLCSSYPTGFTQLGSSVFFFGSSGGPGGIYKIGDDDLVEWVTEASVSEWASLGSLIYFFSSTDLRLFRTDGTREGTFAIGEFAPVPSYLPGPRMAAVNGAIYFGNAGSLQKLTENGSAQAFFSFGDSTSTATNFTALDADRFVFTGCEHGLEQCHAYVSDGTPAGTRSLEREAGGQLTAGATRFLVWRGRAYFETYGPVSPYYQLVSTDGTPEGTHSETAFGESPKALGATDDYLFVRQGGTLYSLHAGGGLKTLLTDPSYSFGPVGRLGDKFVFVYGDPGGLGHPAHVRTAVSNGEPGGTFEVGPGSAGEGGAVHDGYLYFPDSRRSAGYADLWRTDGTAAGTAAVVELLAPNSGLPRPFRVGSTLAVETYDLGFSGPWHLHQVDPATLASRPIAPGPLQVVAPGRGKIYLTDSTSSEGRLFAFDGHELQALPVTGHAGNGVVAPDDHYFFFTDVDPGQLLWETDGSAAGTRQLVDFAPHDATCSGYCGHYGQATISGDLVYFAATEDGEGGRLSVWDRAAGEKRTLFEDPGGPFLVLPLAGGRAAFTQSHFPDEGWTFWHTDGSAAGTRPFFEIDEFTNLMRMLELGGKLYFGLDPGDGSAEILWTSDLTAEGTRPVLPIGKVGFGAMAIAGDHLYFATDAGQGSELAYTDGSRAGTRFLDLLPGPLGSQPDRFFVLDDRRLVFAAAGDDAGYEVWISDGSALGTYRLTDLAPGPAAASPSDFAQVGNRLFFQATDGATGRELWGLELPPAGAAPCPAGRVCLLGGRFEISLVAHAPNGDFPARKEVGNDTSAVYSFFSPGNWEMLLKVLDGCAINGHRWVFAAAATDVGWTLRITDRETGEERVYGNDPGQASPAITDAAAFSCGGALSASPAGAYNAGATPRGAAPWPSSRP